ncbi:hypothetical protein [Pedobacter sp. SYSU D00535]|uniref:hypothetical protein n=1 Tax=Pedobacter sp. SYSU D00535 TaxID=2810308 RepID=UPI001A978579|nr:hypothetical protein [Pedobacter sp. SYSU D00535]
MLFLLIAFSCLLFQFFLPWWIIGPLAFGFSFWKAYSGRNAFQSAFYAVALLWAVIALIHTLENENILANRVGQLFMLPAWNFNWVIMLMVTALIGGLAAGVAALAGYYCRLAFTKR